MPCYNGDDSYDRGYNSAYSEVRKMQKVVEKFEAVLCGIMQIDPTIVDRINWKEVGITKEQHMNWWKEHQKEDAARKVLEAKEKEAAKIERQLRKERKEKARVARIAKLRKELAEAEAEDAKKKAKKKAAAKRK
jgi:hypothetical protein